MSFGLRQALLIALGGIGWATVVTVMARRQLISLRYTIAWFIIALTGMLGALLTPLVEPIGNLFGMSPTGVLLAGATTILLGITLQLSVSVSRLQARLQDVAEAQALLQLRPRGGDATLRADDA